MGPTARHFKFKIVISILIGSIIIFYLPYSFFIEAIVIFVFIVSSLLRFIKNRATIRFSLIE